jgi:hypothetical protein
LQEFNYLEKSDIAVLMAPRLAFHYAVVSIILTPVALVFKANSNPLYWTTVSLNVTKMTGLYLPWF